MPHLPHDQSAGPTGRFHKVALKNVQIWEPCNEQDSTDWLPLLAGVGKTPSAYPIRQKQLHSTSVDRLHVIVQPDGALWLEGCLYLFWCCCVRGLHHSTVSNAAGDLSDMMNKLSAGGRDYNNFRGLKTERPTYFYKSELKLEIARGAIKRNVANRKISNVVGFYKWKVEERGFKPASEMWKPTIKYRRYPDSHGVTQMREIHSTDLSFKNQASIATGSFIKDGGRLHPIDRDNQTHLINALTELGNTEMLLAHIVAITTGMRIQTVLTLRHSCVVTGVGDEEDKNKFALYYIEIGEGTLIDAKNSKKQSVAMPGWVHKMLSTYMHSERHKSRCAKSPIQEDAMQYLFLTKTGKPYYIANCDRSLFGYSAEAGSAIRQFTKKVKEKLSDMNALFSYSFHDLRATFGMNLLEDYMKQRENGKMNQITLLEKLQHRLGHEDINTTLAYLKYREDHPKLAQAQDEYEIHLEQLIRTEMRKHDNQRTSILSP